MLLCSSPYTFFQNKEDKDTMEFSKVRWVPIKIDWVQEAIAILQKGCHCFILQKGKRNSNGLLINKND